MKQFYKMILLLAAVHLASGAFAQTQNTISGTLKDSETKEPLAGVNILIKGSVLGTITDTDGKFQLSSKVPQPYTLVVSFLGYKTQEIVVDGGKTSVDIDLVE